MHYVEDKPYLNYQFTTPASVKLCAPVFHPSVHLRIRNVFQRTFFISSNSKIFHLFWFPTCLCGFFMDTAQTLKIKNMLWDTLEAHYSTNNVSCSKVFCHLFLTMNIGSVYNYHMSFQQHIFLTREKKMHLPVLLVFLFFLF